ncbi:MAG: glycosyltransferase family 2 protein [Armatimonadetes bacterium]|nr:glycosyltransferase family 2 protein [Armatimonadota bacterium]
MGFLSLFFAGFAWVGLLFWASRAWIMYRGQRRTKKLKEISPAEAFPQHALPRLAVLVPSLNEEAGIRSALESLARQDYPGLLIFPINDRSTDRTGEIMEEVAARYPNMHPVHVKELPPGWIGKNHANEIGARAALEEYGAEWLLFTDGDVQFAPQALRRALRYALSRRLDHLAITPELITHSFGEAIFVTTFAVWFMTRFQPWYVEEEKSKQFIGIGAFNLIRAEAYRAIGTHEALALTVADDMALGKRVKESGFRQGYLEGEDEVRVRWQTGLLATVRGLYKNSFASMDFSLAKTVFSVLFIFGVNVLTYALPFLTGGWTQRAAALGFVFLLAVYMRGARILLRCSRPVAIMVALCGGVGGLLFVWTLTASAVLTLRQGGVVWRGTLYPIALLRDHQVRI